MRRTSLAAFDCSIARTLDVVGDPWTLLVVRDALFGVRRFEEFRRSLGVPRATLSTRLASLVAAEVLELREYTDRPTRHEYLLTDKGRELAPVLVAMLQWGDRWSTLEHPPVTLIDAESGRPIEPEFIDARTGRPLASIPIERRRRVATTARSTPAPHLPPKNA